MSADEITPRVEPNRSVSDIGSTKPVAVRPMVLVAEDGKVWQLLLSNCLSGLEVDYVIVDNAEKAIEQIIDGSFTTVITDGLEGKWIQVVEAAVKTGCKVIVLSASPDIVEDASKLGITSLNKIQFSTKTFGSDYLLSEQPAYDAPSL